MAVDEATASRLFPEPAPRNGPAAQGPTRDEITQPARQRADPEVAALARVCEALDALEDHAARVRVLMWAQARFGSAAVFASTTPRKA